MQEAFSNAANGVTRFGLTLDGMKSVNIPCPDLKSQEAIADFLDRETSRINLLIDKKEQLVQLLDQKEKSTVSVLILQGLNKDSVYRQTQWVWRGPVPEHWAETRLKAHFRVKKRQGYPSLTVLSVYREYGVIDKNSRDDNINKTPLDLSSYQLVQPGDLVINKMKSWQGSLGISQLRGITSPDYVVMVPTGEHYSKYIHFLLRAWPMPSVYRMISNGIRPDQWRLEPDRFLSLPMFLPPEEEQRTIANEVEMRVSNLRKIVDVAKVSIDRLGEYRSALITAAVTGQIDVATWSTSGEADRRLDRVQEEMESKEARA